MFSTSSLSSSASHRRFLVCFAGGELGSGDTAAVEVSVVVAMFGGAQAVIVLEGHCWRWRRHFGEFVAVVCVRNWQKIITSW